MKNDRENHSERVRAVESLDESEELMHYIVKHDPNAIAIYDAHLHYIAVSDRYLHDYQVKEEDIIGKHHYEVFPEIPQKWKEVHQRCLAGAIERDEDDHFLRPDGSVTFTRWECRPWQCANGRIGGIIIYTEVITDRKQAENKMQQVSRLYALLSQINQAIMHIKDQDELFLKICQVAIDVGRFRMAWIGLVDQAQERFKPVAHAGHEEGYLDQIIIRTDDNPFVKGPVGRAFREGKIIRFSDIATDPGMIPWRDKALEWGYQSLASVPFRRKGKTVGALTIYGSYPGFLNADEHMLLKEIGENISFALDAMDAEKALIESEVKYRAFFENSMDAILLTGAGGITLSANKAACNMFGYSEEELIRLGKIGIEDETNPRLSHVLDERNLKGKAHGEVSFKRKGGTCFPADISTTIIKNSEGLNRSSIIIRDITERKIAENELIMAKEKAEESDRLKSAFLANMSHEVRTPLNSIIGFSELLSDPEFEAKQKSEFIQQIVTNGNQLLTIISDIMDLSKMESGEIKMKYKQMNALKFISGIKKQFYLQAQERKLELRLSYSETDHEAVIHADADRLRQIFNNLIVNALKFTAQGVIEIGYQLKGLLVEFYVRDTGIGIPAQYQDKIFDRFRQVEDFNTRTYGGNGLGLAISKNLVKLMSGNIWVESELGKGSTFYFTIPRAED